jgi:hypothetical protein
MKIALQKVLILIACSLCLAACAQELHKACPILLKKSTPPDSSSYLLTTADYTFFRGGTIQYAPGIEIIDAAAPWPPRWFALHPADTAEDLSTSRFIMLNAAAQSAGLSFFTVLPNSDGKNNLTIVSCNKKMEITNTFYKAGKEIDSHDFKVSGNGDVMYFLVHDTTMNLTHVYKNRADTAIKVIYESIEITNAGGETVFSWNSFAALGFNAAYLPYRYAPGVMSGGTTFEWSHGNSLEYDTDGNILYSLKNIGIGKLSRTDGHVIWHIDRKKQKANAQSDAIPIYLQHDLQYVKDSAGDESYTVLSNGDDEHKTCEAYQFTVSFDKKGEQVVKLLKKISPVQHISNTGGGGNFDEETNGNYLFNYGLFLQDSALSERLLFEYKNKKSNTTTEYNIARNNFAYRVHRMAGWRPARPQVTVKNGLLATDAKGAVKWYRLSGKDMQTADYISESENITPTPNTYYCAAVKYGIGWSVSPAFQFVQK